ncbi:MAG: hypothetical protein U0324_02825 [Polyangiales bacterium]
MARTLPPRLVPLVALFATSALSACGANESAALFDEDAPGCTQPSMCDPIEPSEDDAGANDEASDDDVLEDDALPEDDAGDDAADAGPDRADANDAPDARMDVATDTRADVATDTRMDAFDARGDDATDTRPDVAMDAAFFPAPTCATVDRRLRADFGIVIQPGTLPFEGLAPESITCQDRVKVYQMFTRPNLYVRYPQRVNVDDAFTIHLYRSAQPVTGHCSAYVPNGQAIQVRDFRTCLASVSGPSDPDFIRVAMFIIHESGHIITARNASLRTAFSSANLPRLDPRCYDRGFLKTYSLRTTNPISESFAEAVALFIGRRKVGVLGTINNFATECPNTFDWIERTVFGAHR